MESDQADETGWRELSRDGKTSILKFLQIYSDKSRSTMKTSGLVFYALYVLILNIIHYVNKRMIARGQCVVAYLTIHFYETEMEKFLYDYCMEIIQKLRRNIHQAITKVMERFARKALSGLLGRKNDEFYLRLHITICTDCADLP